MIVLLDNIFLDVYSKRRGEETFERRITVVSLRGKPYSSIHIETHQKETWWKLSWELLTIFRFMMIENQEQNSDRSASLCNAVLVCCGALVIVLYLLLLLVFRYSIVKVVVLCCFISVALVLFFWCFVLVYALRIQSESPKIQVWVFELRLSLKSHWSPNPTVTLNHKIMLE